MPQRGAHFQLHSNEADSFHILTSKHVLPKLRDKISVTANSQDKKKLQAPRPSALPGHGGAKANLYHMTQFFSNAASQMTCGWLITCPFVQEEETD